MHEPDDHGMQRLACESKRTFPGPVEIVSEQRVAFGRHMDTNLVRAARLQPKLAVCEAVKPLQNLPVRDRRLAPGFHDSHPLAVLLVSSDVPLDCEAVLGDISVDDPAVYPV